MAKKQLLHKIKCLSGFSIIEVTISLIVFIFISLVAWKLQTDVFDLNRGVEGKLKVQQEMRQVLKDMTMEIRSASISDIGSYPISQAAATSFTFFSDYDKDGLNEEIRYFLDGNILKKGIIKPTGNPLIYNSSSEVISAVVHNMKNGATPIFSYYDKSYDGTSAPLALPLITTNVRLVKINILSEYNPLKYPGDIVSLTTQISIRNLKDNL